MAKYISLLAQIVQIQLEVDIFSIVALIFLIAVGYGLYKIEFIINFSTTGKIINSLFIVFPPLAFLATLFKNPGIYDPEENFEPKRTYKSMIQLATATFANFLYRSQYTTANTAMFALKTTIITVLGYRNASVRKI